MTRAAALDGYLPLLAELGINGAALLRETGIDPGAIVDQDRTISYAAFLKALHLARDASGLQHFGLLLAERQPISMFGPLGFAVAEAPTVGAAIEELNRYLHLHSSGNVARLVVDGEIGMWRYETLLPGMAGNAQQEDLAVGIGFNVMRHLCGRDWSPELVTLQRRAPLNTAPWRRCFLSPVEFEAEHNQMVFPRADLMRRVARANSQLHAILNSHLKGLDASGRHDFGSEVQAIILHAMKSGDCALPNVARMLGTSVRTLQRRLADEGRSFREELDSVRSRVAIRYLEETAIPLASLAMTLGYADTTAFSHAFRRLTGQSPARWRARRS
jgi:AraC-like DNA-binding protein